jgi:hypothetical protein
MHLGRSRAKDVRPFNGTADALLGHDLEDAFVGQQANVPVEAARGHVIEFGRKLGGGKGPVTEERPNDAEPDGMKKQVGGRHSTILLDTVPIDDTVHNIVNNGSQDD